MVKEMLGNRLFSVTTVNVSLVFSYTCADISASLANVLFTAEWAGDGIDDAICVACIVSNNGEWF